MMRRHFLKNAFAAAAMLATMTSPAQADGAVKVVYHLSDGLDQASRALAIIRNHLRGAPDTRIVVVAMADGIRFLLKDATERNGKPFAPAVATLTGQGVEFQVCNNTLNAHEIPLSRVIAAAKIVPSGVVEISRLQAREGFVYFRP